MSDILVTSMKRSFRWTGIALLIIGGIITIFYQPVLTISSLSNASILSYFSLFLLWGLSWSGPLIILSGILSIIYGALLQPYYWWPTHWEDRLENIEEFEKQWKEGNK